MFTPPVRTRCGTPRHARLSTVATSAGAARAPPTGALDATSSPAVSQLAKAEEPRGPTLVGAKKYATMSAARAADPSARSESGDREVVSSHPHLNQEHSEEDDPLGQEEVELERHHVRKRCPEVNRKIYLPTHQKYVTVKSYIAAVKLAKANPTAQFRVGLTTWYSVTGAEIVKQFRAEVNGRITRSQPLR
jgi:hypothetical protein